MLSILFIHSLFNHRARVSYVLDFINAHPLNNGRVFLTEQQEDKCQLTIDYGKRAQGHFFIPAQEFIFSEVVPTPEQTFCNSYSSNQLLIHSVENRAKDQVALFIKDKAFAFDLLETIFYHISRYEEWFQLQNQVDKYDRVEESVQLMVRSGLEKIPVVDQLVFCFLNELLGGWQRVGTSYSMSHDIDFLKRNNSFLSLIKSMTGALLKRMDWLAARRLWQQRSEKNPYDVFNWMLLNTRSLEKNIYFLVGGSSHYDPPNNLEDGIFENAIQLSEQRGYRIGLHPSFESYRSAPVTTQEKLKLEQALGYPVQTTRQHFLRFRFPETAELIEKMGFKEDSSIGFTNRIGFRCGTGFPYQLYNFKEERPFNFVERPLVFMDSALFFESDNDPDKFEIVWRTFLSINKYHTHINFNFHNSRFFDAYLYGLPLKRLYKEFFLYEMTDPNH